MVALVCAIFSSFLAMGISVDGLMFLILPLMEKSSSIVCHLFFWSVLAVSVLLAREVFYFVLKYCSAKDSAQTGGIAMKRFIVVGVFLFLIGGSAVADFKYGNEGKVSAEFNNASVDYEALAETRGVVLFSPPSGEGGTTSMASVFFIFQADRSAVGFNIIIDYNGDGQVALVDALLSTQSETRMVLYPINGRDSSDGKRTISITELSRFVDRDGNIEVHISVANGQALTLNSISVEYVYQQEKEVEVRKVTKVVNRYYGVLPPGYSCSLINYYHKGPIWVWVGNGWAVYDGWWYSPTYISWVRVYYPTPIYRYYYHYCGEVYVREKYVYNHNSGSRRRGGEQRDDDRRAPSVQRASAIGNRLAVAGSIDRRGLPTVEKKVIFGDQFGKGKISWEAMAGIIQQSQARKSGAQGSSIISERNPVARTDDKKQQVADAGNIIQRMQRSVAKPAESPVPSVQASPGRISPLVKIFERTKEVAQKVGRVEPSSNGSGSGSVVKRASSSSSGGGNSAIRDMANAVKQRAERTATTPSVQPAPARTETRQAVQPVQQNSSTNSSSSNSDDDEQHKKRRR